MNIANKLTDVYQPNGRVKVTVVNESVEEDGAHVGYRHKVTIAIKGGTHPEKLKFGTDEDIANYVGAVDFDDPQQALPLK